MRLSLILPSTFNALDFSSFIHIPLESFTLEPMTCNQLGGACDLEFHVETFEEMGKLSREHGTKMFEKGDEAHLKAMEKMKPLMKDPHYKSRDISVETMVFEMA